MASHAVTVTCKLTFTVNRVGHTLAVSSQASLLTVLAQIVAEELDLPAQIAILGRCFT